ncbi:DEAD DEAH box helicase [Coemansia sp. RSA 1878]|nr:DEAD DEAH box helicase [Coemansia sp. RSA 1878]
MLRVVYGQRRWTHTLRPYQQECIDKSLSELKSGVWRQAVSLPVGSGKTVVFSNLIQHVKGRTELATKTLVLAHREELLAQAARQIQRASPHLVVEIDQGSRVANPAADVVVASVPTLGREHSERLQRYDPRRFKCIIIDEAHHAAAETYMRILDYFKDKVFVWGCSATLQRHDGLGLTRAFDKIVYEKRFVEMIREGWLSRLRVLTVRTKSHLDSVRSYAGDFSTSSLSAAVNVQERNLAVVQAYKSLAADRRSVLVFAVDVAHARDLAELFTHYGTQAKCVLGSTRMAEREQILHEFRTGTLPVVVNCGILTEGTDIPNIDCVIMARPTRSAVLFQQMLGRGMRKHEGKTDCLVVDFVDSFKSDATQITVPTLLGLDPTLVLDHDDIMDDALMRRKAEQQIQQRKDKDMVGKEGECHTVVREFEESLKDRHLLPKTLGSLQALGFKAHVHLNPLRFFELDKKPENMASTEYADILSSVSCGDAKLRGMSKYSWVCLSPSRYLCTAESLLYFLTLDKSGIWTGSTRALIQYPTPTGMRTHYSKEKQIELSATTLVQGIKGIDRLLAAKVDPFKLKQLHWKADWRKRPPTPKQMQMLNRFGIKEENAEGGDTQLTRGCATNLIMRLTHGSSKTWKQFERAKTQLKTMQEKRASVVTSNAVWASPSISLD